MNAPPLLLDRRRLLGSGALAAAGLALPGCATTAARPTARRGCLPPVNVAANRVIRTIAGLRPYRASGFVVRAGALGDKRLVHNYGHGGSGITMSWGSSRLATDLALPGHSGPVAVIGAGVIGLTTARLVQEAGFPVTIYAAELPPHTTSNIAGGQVMPSALFRQSAITPEWRRQFDVALDYSWRRLQIMVGDDYGVRWVPTYIESNGEPPPEYVASITAGWRELSPDEHPFPLERVARYETLYVETGRFLRQLTRDVQLAGGRIEVRRFATPADIAALPERVVVNCTGLGSRELFGDLELQPVRGQLAILLPQPEIGYAFTGEAGYMFPRADGIILGGTFERDVFVAEPEPADIAGIVDSHRRLFAGFRCTA